MYEVPNEAGVRGRAHPRHDQQIVAEHRAAHRATLKALREAPAEAFAKRHAPGWPGDIVHHVGSHRRLHLDPLVAKPK